MSGEPAFVKVTLTSPLTLRSGGALQSEEGFSQVRETIKADPPHVPSSCHIPPAPLCWGPFVWMLFFLPHHTFTCPSSPHLCPQDFLFLTLSAYLERCGVAASTLRRFPSLTDPSLVAEQFTAARLVPTTEQVDIEVQSKPAVHVLCSMYPHTH